MKQPFCSNKRLLTAVAFGAIGFVLLALLILVMASTRLHSGTDDSLLKENGRPDSRVWVNDGANEVAITPYEGVAPSQLLPEDFSIEDTKIVYHGSSYTALQGIDVSTWQENINWSSVAGDGIDFAFIRIGFRGSRTGIIEEDSCYSDNLADALKHGIQVGVYFYSQATSEEEAKEEANWVLERLGNQQLDLPVMFDWEPIRSEESRSAEWEGQSLTAFGQAFCQTIRDAGRKAGIYFNLQQCYYCYDLSCFTEDYFWLSEPHNYPGCYYSVSFWQYTFQGSVAGISGNVDRCLMFLPRVDGQILSPG
ncbi:MAG: lysozyme [Oscillospiraceae bacterium]|nr:lysozyme [Oscillospiraceae bacterium]